MHLDPRAASELVRASAILVLRILSAQPGDWHRDETSELHTVEPQVAIDDVLKGEVTSRTARFQLQQRRADAVMDSMGLWFQVPLEPGGRLIALRSSPSHDPVEILREGPCNKPFLEPKELAEGVLLRNLLALDKKPVATADQIFLGHEEQRARSLAVLKGRPPSLGRDRPLTWIQAASR
jgi:hypothetical protein